MAFMGKGKVIFLINLTAVVQSIQVHFEYYDTDEKRSTLMKDKLYRIMPGGYRAFPVSKLEKKAEQAERFASLGLVLLVGDSERVRLDQIRNNIGAVVTENAGKLKMAFVSREKFAEKASLSISRWKPKKRTNEKVEQIKKILEGAEIHGNVQAQTSVGTMMEPGESSNQGAEIHGNVQAHTSEENDKGLRSDPVDVSTKMEPAESFNQGAEIHGNAQVHTSEDKDKGLRSDPKDVGSKMEPGESSNQNGPISRDKGQTIGRTGCFNFLPRRNLHRNA